MIRQATIWENTFVMNIPREKKNVKYMRNIYKSMRKKIKIKNV